MKNNKLLAGLVLLSAIVQNLYFCSNDSLYSFTFAVGLTEEYMGFEMIVYLLFITVPMLFVGFFFSENIYGLKNGYGKLFVIRNYSKSRLIMKEQLKVFLYAGLFTLVQALVYLIHSGRLLPLAGAQICRSVLSYFLGLSTLIFLQMFTEIFFSPVKAVMVTHIFLIVSYASANYADNRIIRAVLFPRNMFGFLNGALSGSVIYWESMAILLVWLILISLLSLRKFNKADIF